MSDTKSRKRISELRKWIQVIEKQFPVTKMLTQQAIYADEKLAKERKR